MMLSSSIHRNLFGHQARNADHNPRARGFSLLEVAIVLVIVAILLTSIGVPLSTQIQARRTEETRKLLEDAKDAVLGFAIANSRFPCPATAASSGLESFCPAGTPTGTCVGSETTTVQTHGNCSNFYNGFLPSASLGLSGLDDQGYLRDAFGEQANRIRYAVYSPNRDAPATTVGGENHPFTRPGGMASATVSVLGASSTNYLHVCSSGTGLTASTCGTAGTLTTKSPILFLSQGNNATLAGFGVDETENLASSNNKLFVSHTPVMGGANEFDDVVTWIPVTTIIKKMLDAGKLP